MPTGTNAGEGLPIVRLMEALAFDCEHTDGWECAAPDVRQAAAVITELVEALDPSNVRKAAQLLKEAGNGLHAGLLILMADTQDRALARVRGETK